MLQVSAAPADEVMQKGRPSLKEKKTARVMEIERAYGTSIDQVVTKLRREFGSVSAVARELGVTRRTVQKWRGLREPWHRRLWNRLRRVRKGWQWKG